MRISKVYTRTGDGGETSLVDGRRVSKANARVEAYGDVDELNSVLGLARSLIEDEDLDQVLGRIQNDLFTLGGDLASPAGIAVPRIDDGFIEWMEHRADRYLTQVEPLREFILPGGSQGAATLHLSRAVARRAERRVVALAEHEEINGATLVYLNRLSDLLFILARVANSREGVAETQADFSRKSK